MPTGAGPSESSEGDAAKAKRRRVEPVAPAGNSQAAKAAQATKKDPAQLTAKGKAVQKTASSAIGAQMTEAQKLAEVFKLADAVKKLHAKATTNASNMVKQVATDPVFKEALDNEQNVGVLKKLLTDAEAELTPFGSCFLLEQLAKLKKSYTTKQLVAHFAAFADMSGHKALQVHFELMMRRKHA